MISVRARLALAVRRANSEFCKLPPAAKAAVRLDSIAAVERNVDALLLAGDDLAAIAAIEKWEAASIETFREAANG